MRSVRLSVTVLFGSLALSSCSTLTNRPDQSIVSAAYYGPMPTEHKAAIQDYFKERLFDPFSARYEFSSPKRGWRSSTTVPPVFGWRVIAKVNAKNRMGGYVGWHTYMFIFQGEKIVDMADEDLVQTIYDARGDGPDEDNAAVPPSPKRKNDLSPPKKKNDLFDTLPVNRL